MYRTILHVMVGLLLVGCTTNATITSTYSYVDVDIVIKERPEIEDVDGEVAVVSEKDESPAITPADVKKQDKQCLNYKPIPTPKPIKVDIELIKGLKSADQVNAVLVKNIEDLNKQLIDHAKAQAAHYHAWLKKCQKHK